MKTVRFEKIIICCSAALLSCFVTSCISELEQEKDGSAVLDGVPMALDVEFEDDDALTKSDAFAWPDGATLYIKEPIGSVIGTHYTIYAVYKENIGWTAYNLNGKEGDSECDVYYSESWNYVGNDDYLSQLQATGGAYGGKATCSYRNGTFYLKTILSPLYGRIRFSSDLLVDAEYKHSGNFIRGSSCKNVSSTDYLSFHEENGRYYSDYIYTNVIPEIRIGDYVYMYRGNRLIQPGESGCISLPTINETTSNWLCEKYLEVTYTNKSVSLNTDDYDSICYQLYAQQKDHDSGSGGDFEKYDYGAGPNIFPSSIGLNMELDFTVTSYNHVGYGSTLELRISPLGQSFIYVNLNKSERKKEKIHVCYTDRYVNTADGFVPYVCIRKSYDSKSDSYKHCTASITFYEIKLSNF